jgi:hypothetical protein
MRKTTQVSRLGEDGQSADQPDPGDGSQPLIIRVVVQKCIGATFDAITQLAQCHELLQHKAKHDHGLGVLFCGNADGSLGGEINAE